MKPWTDQLVVVTATANLAAAAPFIESWQQTASFEWPLVIVVNGSADEGMISAEKVLVVRRQQFMGSVPAFAAGVDAARYFPKARVLACLHDDLELREPGWDAQVIAKFGDQRVGLAGFSGAEGLGSLALYKGPYDPMQLAREGFMSNLPDAEAHGRRELTARRVACCDGFSLIGRAQWWWRRDSPWPQMVDAGVLHHAYDSLMGAFAARAGYETWYLPMRCWHAGGRTAVANADYAKWAAPQGGDQAFWQQAHAWGYEEFRDVLPLRVKP